MVKTSTRQTYFLPVIGLVEPEDLSPGDLVGVNKDSYLILEKLPTEYDSRVKAMEVDEKPTEQYSDVGGLDKQIQELIEAIVLPMVSEYTSSCFSTLYSDTQGKIRRNRYISTKRLPNVWTSWNGEDSSRPSLRSSNQSNIPQISRTTTCTDVYRRWCQISPRRIQVSFDCWILNPKIIIPI